MKIEIIRYAFVLVFIAFAAQLILRWFYTPKAEDRYVFIHWIFVPISLFAVSWAFQFWGWVVLGEAFQIFLLYLVIASAWVASYPAIYTASPTLVIAWLIQKKKVGMGLSEIQKWLDLKSNSKERIQDATHDRFIILKGDTVELTRFGRIIFFFFSRFRRWLGLGFETL